MSLINGLRETPVFPVLESLHDRLYYSHALKRGSFSQHGEDVFLLSYFARETRGCERRYVDVGANHPFKISNTYLLYMNGWSGVTIEPIEALWRKHKALRPRDTALMCGVGHAAGSMTFYELSPRCLSTFSKDWVDELVSRRRGVRVLRAEQVEIQTLSEICARHVGSGKIDVLSIDVERLDNHVLMGMDWARWQPTIILVEVGDSDLSADAAQYLAARGYRLLTSLGCNAVFEWHGPQ
jgi:FkbM family methyltransferase